MAVTLTLGALFLTLAANASAMNYAMNFRNYDPTQLETTKRSGATVFRTELDFTCTAGGANWGQFDPIVEAAWKRGITILPILVRSYPACENAEHKRYLNSADGNWGAWYSWSMAAVERYGINGSFWNGKANPTPITAWEVGNEPNLAQNNPGGKNVQPQAYGEFLSYTANALNTGSVTKTAHGTEVISAGLYMPGGYDYGQFLETMGHTNAYTAVGIHPYAFYNGATAVAGLVTNVRNKLNTLPGGSGKALWITEIGWNVGGIGDMPPGTSPVDEPTQAARLNESFDWIQANAAATAKNIALLTWYKIQDQSPIDPQNPNAGHWDEHTGLRRFDGSYRPAWYAFQEQVGAPKWPLAPSVETRAASQVSSFEATLQGAVDPRGFSTSYTFEYGLTTSYGSSSSGDAGSGEGTVAVNARLNGLQPSRTYHFRVVASNAIGTSYGADSQFTTPPPPIPGEDDDFGGPHVVGQSNGALDIFFRTASGGLGHDWFVGAGWNSDTLEGSLATASVPHPIVQSDGSIDVFYRTPTNGLGHNWYGPGQGWHNEPLSATLASDPHPVVRSDGSIDVFYRTPTNGLGHYWYTDALGWHNEPLQGVVGADPYAVENPTNGSIDVFYRTPTNQLGHNWRTAANGWNLENLPGEIASDPHPVRQESGAIDVFYRRPGGGLGHNWYRPGSGWNLENLPGSVETDPHPVVKADGSIDVFYKTPAGGLGHNWYGPKYGWNNEPLSGSVASDPYPVVQQNGTIDVFYRTPTGELGHNYYLSGSGWSRQNLTGTVASSSTFGIHAFAQTNGAVDVFYKTSTGAVGHNWYWPNAWSQSTLPGQL